MIYLFFLHSPVHGHLGYFQSLAFVNNAAINIVYMFLLVCAFLQCIFQKWNFWFTEFVHLNFLRLYLIVLQTVARQSSTTVHIASNNLLVTFKFLTNLMCVKMAIFIDLSLIARKSMRHVFTILVFSSVNCLFVLCMLETQGDY